MIIIIIIISIVITSLICEVLMAMARGCRGDNGCIRKFSDDAAYLFVSTSLSLILPVNKPDYARWHRGYIKSQ